MRKREEEIAKFRNVKEEYQSYRDNERAYIKQVIREYVSSDKFTEKYKNIEVEVLKTKDNKEYNKGQGGSTYTNKYNYINPPYDLSIWKWFYVRVDKNIYFISLQAFDIDHKYRNYHVLTDRIGVYKIHQNLVEEYNNSESKNFKSLGILDTPNALIEMVTTKFELPMGYKEITELVDFLIDFDSEENIEHRIKKKADNIKTVMANAEEYVKYVKSEVEKGNKEERTILSKARKLYKNMCDRINIGDP